MTKKDLFDGLNYIDDQIIEEAQPTGESAGYSDEIYVKNHETHHGGKEDKNRKKHKKFARAAKALATVAAVLVVAVLGTEVVRLNNRIDELETKTANVISQNNAQNNVYAGIKSGAKLGDYEAASDYGKLYDVVKKAEASIRDTAFGELLESADATGIMSDASSTNKQESAANTEYSTTNVMTEGVDESDVVKTDGKYIYMVEDGQISITDISKGKPGEETLFRPDFEVPSDTVEELFISDGKMLIISNHAGDKDETICYSYDIADPTKPVEVNQKLIDSSESWSNEFVYNYKAILADPEKNLIGFTANDYYLFSYDSENGFSLLEQQALTYKNTEGYRGIYKDNDFYVAGNGEIKHFKLAE